MKIDLDTRVPTETTKHKTKIFQHAATTVCAQLTGCIIDCVPDKSWYVENRHVFAIRYREIRSGQSRPEVTNKNCRIKNRNGWKCNPRERCTRSALENAFAVQHWRDDEKQCRVLRFLRRSTEAFITMVYPVDFENNSRIIENGTVSSVERNRERYRPELIDEIYQKIFKRRNDVNRLEARIVSPISHESALTTPSSARCFFSRNLVAII